MKILFFIAPKDFRDEEFFIPKNVFEKKGFKVFTTSGKKGLAIGTHGGEVMVDFLYDDLNLEEYKAIVFVGGKGALEYLDNEDIYSILQKAVSKEVLLGAICISPLIFARAGILKGKRATVWSSSLEKSPITGLKEKGAFYEDKNVVCDGKIVTANGPEAAEEFALKIVELI